VTITLEIYERLDTLERSNRRLKLLLSTCLCGAVALFLMGAASGPKVVEAEKFVLRDGAGVERGEMFATDAARGLVFYNKNGKQAVALVISDQMNGLVVFDQNGNLRQTITSKLDESAWSIFRPGSDSAQFTVTDNALGTGLTVRDRSNGDRVSLGVSDKGAAVGLVDKDGTNRAFVADGDPGFAAYSKSGDLTWAPGWDKFSPEEQNRMRQLLRKSPK
jgi:hypothetical protein